MDIVSAYTPTPKQCMYHSSPADDVLYGGAAGGGKSRGTVEDAFDFAMRHAGVDVYLFRKTYPELKDTLIKEAQMNLPLGKYNQSTHDYNLPNSSKMHFRYCRNMVDAYKYQGTEMHRLYFDELTHFTSEQYNYLKTRVRIPKILTDRFTTLRPQTKSTTNPGGVGHGWVKAKFINNMEPFKLHREKIWSETLQKSKIITRQYIPAYVTDNPHLTEAYVFELEQKPEAIRKALLEGSWDIFEGQVFEEWRDDPRHYLDKKWTHVIEPFKIPSTWKRFTTFDFGYSKPFSFAWWAMDHDGRLYRYRELYGCVKGQPDVGVKWTPDEIANYVKQMEDTLEEKGQRFIRYADPAIFEKSTGESIAEVFEKRQIFMEPADNKRINGKMQMHYRFAFDDMGIPMMYSFKTCKGFNRTIPTLVYDINKVEDVDTATEDHAYDEARYLASMHPIPPKKNKMKIITPYDPLATTNENDWNDYGFIRINP